MSNRAVYLFIALAWGLIGKQDQLTDWLAGMISEKINKIRQLPRPFVCTCFTLCVCVSRSLTHSLTRPSCKLVAACYASCQSDSVVYSNTHRHTQCPNRIDSATRVNHTMWFSWLILFFFLVVHVIRNIGSEMRRLSNLQ